MAVRSFKILSCLAKATRCIAFNECTYKSLLKEINNVNCIQYRLCTSVINSHSTSTKKIPSGLEPAEIQDLSDYGSALVPSHNLAAYADKSVVLQELIKLGVELYKFDKNPKIGKFILRLDFEKDIKPYLLFLHDNGVAAENLGNLITKNPFILKENLSDLEVRINYLESKKFDKSMISNIITKNPYWLSIPVRTIDKRIGYLQETFSLKGDQVRKIISEQPKLVICKKQKFFIKTYVLKEEMELDVHSMKKLIVTMPEILLIDEYQLLHTYDYLTKTMRVPQSLILKQPKILNYSKSKMNERHRYLEALGRAQYNPLLPGYISLMDIMTESDSEFCQKIAKTSIVSFNEFLKTL